MKATYAVYTIVPTSGEDYWLRIGSGWKNKDGSMNIVLNALPINGKLHIREARAKCTNDSEDKKRKHKENDA